MAAAAGGKCAAQKASLIAFTSPTKSHRDSLQGHDEPRCVVRRDSAHAPLPPTCCPPRAEFTLHARAESTSSARRSRTFFLASAAALIARGERWRGGGVRGSLPPTPGLGARIPKILITQNQLSSTGKIYHILPKIFYFLTLKNNISSSVYRAVLQIKAKILRRSK